MFYTGLVGSVLTAPALPFLWQTPTEASTWIGIHDVDPVDERGDDREQSRRVHPREPRPAHHQDPGDPPETTMFYTGLVGSVLTAPALPFLWQTPTEASTAQSRWA
jgi:hypothetical protein